MAIERGLNDPALHTASAAVHEPHLFQSRFGRRVDVVSNEARNILRRKRVQIEFAFDRDTDGFVSH
jgi:hypothetical protein